MPDKFESGVYEHPEDSELAGTFDWRLVVNGRVVATSHNQGYRDKAKAKSMYYRVVSGGYKAELLYGDY